MPRPVLFYSQFCAHSSNALRAIATMNIRAEFAVMCVDGMSTLPAGMDRVPLLFTHDRRLLSDDALFMYIATFKKSAVQDFSPEVTYAVTASHPNAATQCKEVLEPIAAEARGASRSGGTMAYSSFMDDDDANGAPTTASASGCGTAGSFHQLIHEGMEVTINGGGDGVPVEMPGGVPGRGMSMIANSGSFGEPPARMMPTLSGIKQNNDKNSGVSLETMESMRRQEEQAWASRKR